MTPANFLSAAAAIAGGMLALAAFLSFLRLIKGPTLPDRVVALDLITTLTVAAIVVYTLATNQKALLDATVVVALVAFLATVAFARYVETRARHD